MTSLLKVARGVRVLEIEELQDEGVFDLFTGDYVVFGGVPSVRPSAWRRPVLV